MYGHKWVSSYGADVDPDRVWQATLSDLSPDQIKHGLRRCTQDMLDWPPSAPEFRKLCLGVEDNGDEYCKPVGIHKVFPKMLEDKGKQERAKTAGETELAKLREIF
jgi:hypothetical protein